MNENKIKKSLDARPLSKSELLLGPEEWASISDPFPDGDGNIEELEENQVA